MKFFAHIQVVVFIGLAMSAVNTSATTMNNTTMTRTLTDSAIATSCSDGICDVSETSNSCPQDCANRSLNGTNAGTNGGQGVMFEVVAKRDVTVKSFSFYTDAARTGVIEVYTRVGTYGGYELVSAGWSLVYNKTVTQNGRDVLTLLGDFTTGVTIPSGSKQSFYITTAVNNYVMYEYRAGTVEGAVLSEDNALILYYGECTSVLSRQILVSMLNTCVALIGKGTSGKKFPGAGTTGVLFSPRSFKGFIK